MAINRRIVSIDREEGWCFCVSVPDRKKRALMCTAVRRAVLLYPKAAIIAGKSGRWRERERRHGRVLWRLDFVSRSLRGESMILAPRDLFIFRNNTNNVCSPWHLCRDNCLEAKENSISSFLFFLSPSYVDRFVGRGRRNEDGKVRFHF